MGGLRGIAFGRVSMRMRSASGGSSAIGEPRPMRRADRGNGAARAYFACGTIGAKAAAQRSAISAQNAAAHVGPRDAVGPAIASREVVMYSRAPAASSRK